MSEEEKSEISALYTKYAKQGLADCKDMTPEEEKKYVEEKEKEILNELEKIKKKYSTQQ